MADLVPRPLQGEQRGAQHIPPEIRERRLVVGTALERGQPFRVRPARDSRMLHGRRHDGSVSSCIDHDGTPPDVVGKNGPLPCNQQGESNADPISKE
jgi:hypothetical protein